MDYPFYKILQKNKLYSFCKEKKVYNCNNNFIQCAFSMTSSLIEGVFPPQKNYWMNKNLFNAQILFNQTLRCIINKYSGIDILHLFNNLQTDLDNATKILLTIINIAIFISQTFLAFAINSEGFNTAHRNICISVRELIIIFLK